MWFKIDNNFGGKCVEVLFVCILKLLVLKEICYVMIIKFGI